MALFKIFKGSNTAKITNSSATGYITPTDGYAYYDTGSKLFYIDAAYSGTTISRQPINADNATNGVFYGTCSTAQGTKAKVATLTNGTGFSLKAGTIVVIKFTYASAASTMTLNVNGTGAKNLYQYGTTLMNSGTTTTGWPAGAVVPFVYDGTYWFRLYWTNTGTVTSITPGNGLLNGTGTSAITTTGTLNLNYGTSASAIGTTSAAGSANTVSRSDHVHNITLATGDNNGQVKIAGQNVDVKGLGSNAYTSTAYAPLASPALTGTPTAPTPAATSNDTTIATTAFVMNAFTANDAMLFKGVVNANGNLPATHKQGWTYRVATAGTYAGKVCEVGDIIICVTDGTAANNDHWAVIQNNVDGAVYRGTNAFTDANVIVADSTNGKVKSSGKTITTTAPSSSAADTTIPTSKAVWSAISGASGYGKTGTVTSITLKAGTGISLDTDNTAITTSGTRTITNTGVTGIKGNAESTYRTGQVNLTAAQTGAIPADTAGNTQSLSRPSQSNGVNDITLDSKINDLRANRLAFLPADQIIIEKTTDGGTTWTDAEVSDSAKLSLFSETRPNVYIPLLNDAKNVNCGLRITFTAMKYNVPAGTAETQKYNYWNSNYILSTERYNQLKEMYFWANSNSDTIGVKVERATGVNSTNWIKLYDSDENSYGMTGWSGSDYIKFSQGVFGGSTTQTHNYWNYRLTFFTRGPGGDKTTLSGTNTSSRQFISEIRGYGDAWWTAGNTYAAKDHLYSFDYLKNATFPAKVTATSFAGNGSALTSLNATNLTSGTVSEDRLPENAKLFKRGTGAYSIASINSSSTTAQPIASGSASVAMGEYTEASGGASTAFGNRGKALGKGSFVCGTVYSGGTIENKAVGDGSAVFGASNTVYCSYGASFGAKNIIGDENATANAAYSVAYGLNNKIAGGCGFITGGYNEITKGLCGTIFGYSNTVNEGYGTAFGQNNIVNGKYSTVIGKYNEADTTVTDSNANGTYSFMIGNGTANDARSNAMEVSWAGDVNAQTSLSVAKAVSMVYNATTNALDFVFA